MAKAVTETKPSGLMAALAARRRAAGDGPAWLEARRAQAEEAFAQHGIPTRKDEAWKKTDLRALDTLTYAPPQERPAAVPEATLDLFRLGTVDRHEAVFLDGVLEVARSRLDALPEGVEVTSLAAKIAADPAALETDLAAHATTATKETALVALNTATFQDGAYVRLAKGTVLDLPLHILWLTTAHRDGPAFIAPRTLVVAEPLAEGTILESFGGTEGAAGFVDAVTELVAHDDAKIDHVTLQRQDLDTTHVHHVHGQAARSARIATFVHSEGARTARNEAILRLAGEGAECGVFGLFLGAGDQHVDNHTVIDHAKPHTSSVENYRGILTGSAHGVFTGSILVRKDAQKTNAQQENRNLILSDRAHVDTTPQLEIFADDVKCSHGSTIGQLDPRSLFYLRSRGFSEEEARLVLTQAFAGDVVANLRHDGVRAFVEERVAAWFAAHRTEAVA